MPPSTVLTSDGPAALSAASCVGPLPMRLLSTSTGLDSEASKSAENGGKGWDVEPGGGRMPVLANPQSGSMQPAGIAGELGNPVTTVLLAPLLLIAPEAVESVMAPALAPTKPPTTLLSPVLLTAPVALEAVMTPALVPVNPPTVLLAPVLLTAPEAVESVIAPALVATKPPIVLFAPMLLFAPDRAEAMTPPALLAATPPI